MFRQLQMPQQSSQPQHRDGQESQPIVQFQKVNGCDLENEWLSCCFHSLAADYYVLSS